MVQPGGAMFDPDEAVLILCFVFPALCLLSDGLPQYLNAQARYADVQRTVGVVAEGQRGGPSAPAPARTPPRAGDLVRGDANARDRPAVSRRWDG